MNPLIQPIFVRLNTFIELSHVIVLHTYQKKERLNSNFTRDKVWNLRWVSFQIPIEWKIIWTLFSVAWIIVYCGFGVFFSWIKIISLEIADFNWNHFQIHCFCFALIFSCDSSWGFVLDIFVFISMNLRKFV